MSTHDGQPPLRIPAPRHLHRQPFRPVIADELFAAVPTPTPTAVHPPAAMKSRPMKRDRRPVEPRHKRMVASALVIAAVACIPALLLALFFFT